MDEELKTGLKKIVKGTELKVAESILRWKYKKEGKKIPHGADIERQSKQIAEEAHQIIAKRGKNIWNELIRVSRKGEKGKGSSD
jgi:hypothetical protein